MLLYVDFLKQITQTNVHTCSVTKYHICLSIYNYEHINCCFYGKCHLVQTAHDNSLV